MKTRAAVAWEAAKPLSIETIELEGPKAGEVLVEIMATGICHTDAYTLSGADSEGKFPAILGHEGAGIVREIGPGVTTVKVGEHVIPLYTPECRQCKTCLSRRSNLCTAIRATQGQGVMPDGTSRFRCDGDTVFHYMGCSTFSNFTVLPEIALAKVRDDAPFDKICYIGCGVTTGIGAVIYTAKVWPGANVAVFGLGGIGLNVIQGARMVGADKIVGIDLNPGKRAVAEKFGMTHFVNPDEVGRDKVVQAIVDLTGGGADFSFECIGNVAHHAPGARMLPPRLGRIDHHRRRRGRPRDRDATVPARHRPGVARHRLRRRARAHRRAEDRRLVHGGQDQHRRSHHPQAALGAHQRGLRPDARGQVDPRRRRVLMTGFGSDGPRLERSNRCYGGSVGVYAHGSSEIGGGMRFSIYLPPAADRGRVPALLYLAGLTCNEDTFMTKAGAIPHAAAAGLALVAPDTSPRDRRHPGDDTDWDFGLGAGFYVDATQAPWRDGYRMYSYVTQELPALIAANFPVDGRRLGIFGHSMGGHGALVAALRNPQRFRSVSAFAPICAPMRCPWGEKAFSNYLGPDRDAWRAYDATELVRAGARAPEILIDQGEADQFLETQLHPHLLEEACRETGQPLQLRRHPGYDHSYYFIQTFIADHVRHHSRALSNR